MRDTQDYVRDIEFKQIRQCVDLYKIKSLFHVLFRQSVVDQDRSMWKLLVSKKMLHRKKNNKQTIKTRTTFWYEEQPLNVARSTRDKLNTYIWNICFYLFILYIFFVSDFIRFPWLKIRKPIIIIVNLKKKKTKNKEIWTAQYRYVLKMNSKQANIYKNKNTTTTATTTDRVGLFFSFFSYRFQFWL